MQASTLIVHHLSKTIRNIAMGTLLPCVAILVMGCQTPPKAQEPSPVPSTEQVEALKASIEKADPGAVVGEVIFTLSNRPYTAVGDVAMDQIKVGQTVSFVDANGIPINNGTVVAIVGDNAHIRFDPTGKRPPQKGDLAVWLKG